MLHLKIKLYRWFVKQSERFGQFLKDVNQDTEEREEDMYRRHGLPYTKRQRRDL